MTTLKMKSSRPDASKVGDAYWFETQLGVCATDEPGELFMFHWEIRDDGKAYYLDSQDRWEIDTSFPYEEHREWLANKAEEFFLEED